MNMLLRSFLRCAMLASWFVLCAAQAAGYAAWVAGRVKEEGRRKAVVVPPLGLTFEGDTLQVR